MKMGPFAAIMAIVALSILLPFEVIATEPPNDCTLPDDLQREVTKKHPGTKVVRLSDIGDEDRRLFKKDHGDACPGLAKVDFYGDGKPTFALALITRSESNATTELVIAHQYEAVWKLMSLGKADGPVPVVWSDKPGEYTDVDGAKKIRATKQVIVFCRYSAWAVLYAWKNNQ